MDLPGARPSEGRATAPVHLKGLNGLRAIAALAVMYAHVASAIPRFGAAAPPSSDLAGFGVTIFFALSGFLITYLLIRERETAGTVSIGRFYVRRALRIWPLYFGYLLLNLVLVETAGDVADRSNLLWHLAFLPNVAFVRGEAYPNTDHYWSLGVEEQFYLFWPLLVALAGRRLLGWMLAFAGAFFALKVAANLAYGSYSAPYTFLYATRFDCMAIGGVGAWVFRHREALSRAFSGRWLQAGAWGILALTAVNRFHLRSVVDHEVVAAATVILILALARQDERPALVGLETRLFDFLGGVSYGLYVYHPAVIYVLPSIWGSTSPSWENTAAIFATAFGLTIGLAWLSHRILERPFLEWKTRFAVVPTAG